MPHDEPANTWLDPELHPVALRRARADECMFEIGRLAVAWSAAGPVRPAMRPEGNEVVTFVDAMRPIPPPLSMLFSEAANHLRAALHPLLLLQACCNEDKHRSIRVAVERTIVRRDDWPASGQDRSFRELKVGDVLGRTALGEFVELDTNTAAVVERPDPFKAFVSPVNELNQIRAHLADIAIPTLVTGMALPRTLPPDIDLRDNGKTLAERIDDGR